MIQKGYVKFIKYETFIIDVHHLFLCSTK